MQKRKQVICALLVLFSASMICGETIPSKVVVVLFDLSGSTARDRGLYMKEMEKVLSAVRPGDALLVDKITDNPMSESDFPVQEEFPGVADRGENPLWQKAFERKAAEELESRKSVIRKKIKGLVESKATKFTDIFGALGIAERVFNSFPRDKKILVVVSDMLQESSTCNFKTAYIGGSRTRAIIERERKSGRLPDLKGVKVYVSGANAVSSTMFERLFRFWQSYFSETGARLAEENFGHVLLVFKE